MEAQTKTCPRCKEKKAFAQFNGAIVMHKCPHGNDCTIWGTPCEDCAAGRPASERKMVAPPAPSFGSRPVEARVADTAPVASKQPEQASLFGGAVPVQPGPMPSHAKYVIGSDTSKDASSSLELVLNDLQLLVLKAIEESPNGMTCDEVEIRLSLRHQTASARVNELMEAKYIVDSGERRKTSSGRKATVWKARGLVVSEPQKPEEGTET